MIIKIGVAADHAGYQMKELLVGYLDSTGYEVFDFGCANEERCDYPDYAHPLAQSVESGEVALGFTLCGSGNGIAMAANKHAGIRAALCWSEEIARLARAHNDANICSLPSRFISNEEALAIVDTFLNTAFEGQRHQQRVAKIPLPVLVK